MGLIMSSKAIKIVEALLDGTSLTHVVRHFCPDCGGYGEIWENCQCLGGTCGECFDGQVVEDCYCDAPFYTESIEIKPEFAECFDDLADEIYIDDLEQTILSNFDEDDVDHVWRVVDFLLEALKNQDSK